MTNCTEKALRAAMAGGGVVTFACDGTIFVAKTLTNDIDLVMDGMGHQVIISGSNTVRVFYLNTNASLVLANLTIANGRSDKGGGVFNSGGQLTLQSCRFANNSAIGPSGITGPGTNGCGGAIYNLGVVHSINCAYISNSVVGGMGGWAVSGSAGGDGGHGNGGAVENFGTFIATACVLAGNSAAGGNGAGGYTGNPGSAGGAGGDGNGSAIANFGILTMSNCLLTNNSANGGTGGTGGAGSYSPPYGVGGAGGPGGLGGSGNGVLYNNGSAFLVNNTFALNSGAGAQGGAGGSGGPPFNQSSTSGNGGQGSNGGSGYGAISDRDGQCYLTNCTLAFNQAIAGSGGLGGPAGPWPYPYPPRVGTPGGDGLAGPAGSALNSAGAHLINTLLASNTPANCAGAIADAGHNLSSDASPGFTGPGSLTNTDPKIALLANNGGPTLTMALLYGSPAIDAADASAAPYWDQRGFPRPAGSGPDMGSFESGSILPSLSITVPAAGHITIVASGNSNQWFRLLSSSNLFSWFPITTNQFGTNSTCLFQATCEFSTRFYQVIMP